MKAHPFSLAAVAGLFLLAPASLVAQLPSGANVVAGQVAIAQTPGAMTLAQSSRHAIVNWQSFDIGAGHSVRLQQAGVDAAMLARVTGGDPSKLLGSLQADGKLFLINPKGILVGAGATIDTAGFIGSTLDVSDTDFLRGTNLAFKGDSAAGIVNLGTIAAREGNVLLFAHAVSNAGSITAPKGTAGLGAGTAVHLASPDAPSFTIKLNLGATAEKTGVENSGAIAAAQAQLEAAGGSIYELAVNQSGVVRATGVENRNGRVLLTAAGGTVGVSGSVSARNADGAGGEILVGGDYRGSAGVPPASEAGGTPALLPNAARTVVTSTAKLDASAVSPTAAAGRVIVWADDATRFLGTIDARGAGGGFAEVSGKRWLDFNPGAPVQVGAGGTLLLDPDALVVSAGADSGTSTSGTNPFVFGPMTEPATLNVTTLQNQLALSNVTLDTSTSAGDITVAAPVTWSTNNTLRLQAGGSINLDASLTGGAASTLALYPGRNATPSVQGPPHLNNRATLDGGAAINVGTLTYGANAQSAPTGYTIDAPASVAPLTLNGNVSAGTLELDLSGGAAGVTTNGSDNAIGAFTTTGSGTLSGAYVVDHHGGLDVTVNSATAEGPYLQFITPGALTLQGGSSVNFATPGTVLLASTGGAFVNQAGAAVFGANARYLIYTSTPAATTAGGLTATEVFSTSYNPATAPVPFDGDMISRFIYSGAAGSPIVGTLNYHAAAATRLYGGANPTFGYSVTGLLAGDTLAGVVSGAPSFSTLASQSSGVGTYAITITQGTLNSLSYDFAFTPGTLTIDRAPLTITANNAARTYGAGNPAFTASFSGLVAGDTSAVVSGLTFGTSATGGSNVGSYTINTGGGVAANYTLSFLPGTLSVTPAPLSLSVNNAARVYGDANPAFTGNVLGLMNGESAATAGVGFATTATVVSPVNSLGYPVSASLMGGSGNYFLAAVTPGTLAITPAPLTVAIDDQARRYGDADPGFTYTLSGLKNDDNEAAVVTVRDLVSVAAPTAGVGDYGILGTAFTTSANYSVTTRPGTLSVTPRPLTITADNQTRVYGDANPVLTATFSGLAAFDTPANLGALNLTTPATPASGVSNFGITFDPVVNPNYTIKSVFGQLAITPAPLTLLPLVEAARIYGRADPVLTLPTVDGLKLADTVAGLGLRYELPAATADAGNHTYRLLTTNPNYALTQTTGVFRVDPAPLTVAITPTGRLYGDANPASYAFTANGLAFGDTAASVVRIQNATGSATNVGTYSLTPLLNNRNYAIGSITGGAFTINPRVLTLDLPNVARTYGDTNPAFNRAGITVGGDGLASFDGIDSLVTDLHTAAPTNAQTDVGYYRIDPAFAANPNYRYSWSPGYLAIVPRAVEVLVGNGVSFGHNNVPAGFDATAYGLSLIRFGDGAAPSGTGYNYSISNLPAFASPAALASGVQLTLNPSDLPATVGLESSLADVPFPTRPARTAPVAGTDPAPASLPTPSIALTLVRTLPTQTQPSATKLTSLVFTDRGPELTPIGGEKKDTRFEDMIRYIVPKLSLGANYVVTKVTNGVLTMKSDPVEVAKTRAAEEIVARRKAAEAEFLQTSATGAMTRTFGLSREDFPLIHEAFVNMLFDLIATDPENEFLLALAGRDKALTDINQISNDAILFWLADIHTNPAKQSMMMPAMVSYGYKIATLTPAQRSPSQAVLAEKMAPFLAGARQDFITNVEAAQEAWARVTYGTPDSSRLYSLLGPETPYEHFISSAVSKTVEAAFSVSKWESSGTGETEMNRMLGKGIAVAGGVVTGLVGADIAMNSFAKIFPESSKHLKLGLKFTAGEGVVEKFNGWEKALKQGKAGTKLSGGVFTIVSMAVTTLIDKAFAVAGEKEQEKKFNALMASASQPVDAHAMTNSEQGRAMLMLGLFKMFGGG